MQAMVPVMLAVIGYVITTRDKSDSEARYESELFEKMICHLTVGNQPAEQKLALKAVPKLFNGGHGADFVQLVTSVAETATDPLLATQAVEALRDLAAPDSGSTHTAIAQEAVRQIESMPTRVYMQIESEAQRSDAVIVQGFLQQSEVVVPGIENVKRTIHQAALKYFDEINGPRANQIVEHLEEGRVALIAEYVRGYPKIAKNQYELWLNDAALRGLHKDAGAAPSLDAAPGH